VFEFLIGSRQKVYTVHTGAISAISEALNAMINGNMKEASEGKVIMEDVKEPVWERFCQFAYGGDYETPSPMTDSATLDKDTEGDVPLFEPPSRNPEGLVPTSTKQSRHYRAVCSAEDAKLRAWDAFRKEKQQQAPSNKLSFSNTSSMDYTEVLLCHAELYVLADKWGVDPLRYLCLQKLRRVLATFVIYQSRREELCRLIDYCYENTRNDDDPCPLRFLIANYVSLVIEHLVDDAAFRSLLGRRGFLSKDVLMGMTARLSK
jgi:hypothetical protein